MDGIMQIGLMMIHKQQIVMIIVTVLLLSISCGGGRGQESPAPGCNTGGGCFPVMGGCFGKTVIQEFEVVGGGDCLDWRVNNCNGGVVTVRNGCDDVLVLGEIDLPTGGSMTLDVRRTANGQFEFYQIASNFSEFVPDSDLLISISGMLGDQIVRVSFIKTAQFCE